MFSPSPSSSSSRPSWSARLNAPRPIFLGWTAMIFIAGTSYWFVKERNLQKRKTIMRREAEEKRRELATNSEISGGGISQSGTGGSDVEGEDGERTKEASLARYLAQGERRERQESGQAGVGGAGAGAAQSPLQSLLNQLNRQTSQRRRGGGGEE
ncbi:hypothetical protein BCV69DRAFT_299047 [Microstroma glucosiphilum]|uniref:Transmembrane protein n=1 Tax=Pseudomicrostroma glucosiphilum TaxID=1684307 RepID=A0A316UC35_9BASI|nr:hypothetical protein BCV69DRAFT_299047 [Pseudomicrostroma glucosiphilum]PWN20565.1 hypothetical protein BCV69DRAFT_299047 [Pseudomicrostroma glucosiphilum]